MKINLTPVILKKQIALITELSTRLDMVSGGEIFITLNSCYELLADTYEISPDIIKNIINGKLE